MTATTPGYFREPVPWERGWPRGPLFDHRGPHPDAPFAIGFCPKCTANARRSCSVRGFFLCPNCLFPWYDERVGKQRRRRSLSDYITRGEAE